MSPLIAFDSFSMDSFKYGRFCNVREIKIGVERLKALLNFDNATMVSTDSDTIMIFFITQNSNILIGNKL